MSGERTVPWTPGRGMSYESALEAEIEALREVVAMMAEYTVIPSRIPRHDDVIARALGDRRNEAPQGWEADHER
jgi:hypothetical protein